MTNEIDIIIKGQDKSAPAFESAEKRVSKFAGATQKMKATLAGAGAAGAALFTKGLLDNLDIEQANAKLAAQLNLTEDQAKNAGEIAAKVYADGWGESTAEVNDALVSVNNNIQNISNSAPDEIQKITDAAFALSKTFDVDVNESTKAAGALMKNGLAKDAADAMDIITGGFQLGLNSSDDFLETLNEYAPHFAKLGLSGEQSLGVLNSFIKAGVKDTDAAADAFKEFSLRAIDGSEGTMQAYKDLGLNAKQMSSDIAAGGDKAADGLDSVITALQNTKEPLKQNQIGTALFGTQWEDTVRTVLPELQSVQDGTEDVAGAAEDMADTIQDNAQTKVENFSRKIEQWTQEMAGSNDALGLIVTGAVQFGGAIGPVALGVLQATDAMKALNFAFLSSPIFWIIGAIALFVAGLVIAYKKSETFRKIVDGAFSKVKKGAQFLLEKGVELKDKLVEAFSASSDSGKKMRSALSTAMSVIRKAASILSGAIKTYFKLITTEFKIAITVGKFMYRALKTVFHATGSAIQTMKNVIKSAVSSIKQLFNSLVSKAKAIKSGVKAGISGVGEVLRAPFRIAIQTIKSWLGGLISYAKSIGAKAANAAKSAAKAVIPGLATGGFSHAAEGGLPGGNNVLVGENGPELVQLPYGTRVIASGQTQSMVNSAGGNGSGQVVLEINSSGAAVDDLLLQIIRKAVRVRGGNVQLALGR